MKRHSGVRSDCAGTTIRPYSAERHARSGPLCAVSRLGVTKWLRGDSPWQRNHYEIIVRSEAALANIRDNPANGDVLRSGEPRFAVGILTDEIMQGAFDLKVDAYKQVKGLERANLRDHMTDIELILTMLAEATTTNLHKDRDSKGKIPLTKDAQDGGAVAGRTRKDIETQTGTPVISPEKFKVLEEGRTKGLKGTDRKS